MECKEADGGIGVGDIVSKRPLTVGCVEFSCFVVVERIDTGGGVIRSGGGAIEGVKAKRGIVEPGCTTRMEGAATEPGVVLGY